MSDTLALSASGFDYMEAYEPSGPPGSDNTIQEESYGSTPWPVERHEISFRISSETASSAWFQKAISDLIEVLNMGPNWNGYGEEMIHASSAKRLVHILDRMEYKGPPVAIVPLSSGGLQLEWHRGARSLEVEVPPEGDAEVWFIDDDSGDEDDWVVSADGGLQRLAAYLKELLIG